jgi:cob(I)alamin adenosyltransferase
MARKRDEPVRLTRIYTRTGDEGETSLGDGSRVAKTDSRIAAVGAVEELNAHLGLIQGWADIQRIQNELFDLGADFSVPYAEGDGKLRIEQTQIDALEKLCDASNANLEPLKSFVLPGGTSDAALLHLARTVCRRAELAALRVEPVNPLALTYLNRLSDVLFVLARAANADRGRDELLWKPGGSR